MMRASGILLPISSIPSNYGIGCFSKEAYAFVDQLAEAGQKYLADSATWTYRIWRFPVSVLFHICRKPVFY